MEHAAWRSRARIAGGYRLDSQSIFSADRARCSLPHMLIAIRDMVSEGEGCVSERHMIMARSGRAKSLDLASLALLRKLAAMSDCLSVLEDHSGGSSSEGQCPRRNLAMIANIGRESLDDAFRRVRDLDVSLREQLRAFAETVRRDRPEFAAAVDRLVTRLRQYGAGESAPQIGEPMPPFVLPDETGQMVSLDELLNRGPVAVTFHRGHWCPYCRININALVQAHKELTADAGPDRRHHA